MSDGAKHTIDALSIGTMLGAIVQWLPSIAALLTVVWTAIRIYETPTVQRLLQRPGGGAE
ncbi:hypothetical protein MB02_01145 [Croceicoccus estronivorus]|nr:hypothetical protein MB02_01145 [Croceicoccus estronivorus]